MFDNSLPSIIVIFLSNVFAASAILHLVGPPFVLRAYKRWDFPPKFHLVTGLAELLTMLLLIFEETRVWGIILAGVVLFVAEITLLESREYLLALPCLLLMIALAPAALAT
jgi:hypothetical protein